MIVLSIVVCVAGFSVLVWLLRQRQVSLGIPIAYLASLLLIHVPGAIAHVVDVNGILKAGTFFTQIGIGFTAVGTVFFVIGVWLAHRGQADPIIRPAHRTLFAKFCLIAGAGVTVITPFIHLPSIGAVVQRGSFIWMLAVILGLKSAIGRRDAVKAWKWVAALMVYPTLMLLLGGFLSYGVSALITTLSIVLVTARSPRRIVVGTILCSVAGISIFISYFEHRGEIRGAVWGGASAEQRISASVGAAKDIAVFDRQNASHLIALDERLNQNYFVGLAAARISAGQSHYLYGRSLWEGFAAMVPRALWPDKPFVAGSGTIVSEMTGLELARNTSFGVGNVMEFQINFGIFGIVLGFLLLGWGLGRLDRLAATADIEGHLGQTLVYFLPAVALIQPNGSIVEMTGGAVSALAAAYVWKWAWSRWPKPTPYRSLALGKQLVRPVH
jgi:hypothetical protein